MAKKDKIKFEFGTDFQEQIIKFTVTDKKGYKALELYNDSYFVMLEHAIIVNAIKRYYKKRKKVPDKVMLKETLRGLYQRSESNVFQKLQNDDREKIDKLIDNLYMGNVTDGEEILAKCRSFAQHVEFKHQLEQIDVLNYEAYEGAVDKLKKALNVGNEVVEEFGTFLIGGIKDRAHKRDTFQVAHPTPFKQFNALSNAGGLTEGSLVMVMSEAKRFKTGFLINLAKFYLKKKKRILYIDLENGEDALTVRAEQSIMDVSQKDILGGDYDNKLLKLFRKYKRIGADILFKRMPAYLTTCNDIQKLMDKVYVELGITFDVAIIDYGDLLGSNENDKEEFARISNAYVDMKNLANFNKLESIWTASHVKTEAASRRATKFQQKDVAKCIDKMRHVDVALGLQESDEEIENKVLRVEIVEQRNGMRDGKMLFWVDMEKQTMNEFTHAEIENYYTQLGETSPTEKEEIRNKKAKALKDI